MRFKSPSLVLRYVDVSTVDRGTAARIGKAVREAGGQFLEVKQLPYFTILHFSYSKLSEAKYSLRCSST